MEWLVSGTTPTSVGATASSAIGLIVHPRVLREVCLVHASVLPGVEAGAAHHAYARRDAVVREQHPAGCELVDIGSADETGDLVASAVERLLHRPERAK
eukprot:CAMPEP_0196140808 /NCGR_PEP_ID=MMETSP0910-20130528/7582_1 /TAXON_ID=49265 /ORGANISM="Thalassiosira rotula, Strain GSO102" /LENGTH=98 /DNA_ID=CAMNT_0041401721 /DNA_START=10 /DNA_END=307 /DNA_ORIENTATION=+